MCRRPLLLPVTVSAFQGELPERLMDLVTSGAFLGFTKHPTERFSCLFQRYSQGTGVLTSQKSLLVYLAHSVLFLKLFGSDLSLLQWLS